MSINSTYCITLKLQALILWAFSQLLLFRIEISERLNRIVILRAMKSNYWTSWRLLFYLNYCLWHLDLNHYFNLYICLSFYPAFLCQTSEFHHVQCQVPHLIASTVGWVQDWGRSAILITYDNYTYILNLKLVWSKCNILKYSFLGQARCARSPAS